MLSRPPSAAPHLSPSRRHLNAFLGYLALAVLFYLPQLLGLAAFPDGDFNQHFLPFSLFQRAELLAGRLPVWNPYTYGGHPFLADVQAAVYYPLSNLVLWLTLPFASPAARLYFLEVEAALHLALAGFFTYLLVRELTGRPTAGFLAGAAFAFSGYLTGYPPLQLAVLRTAIWLPLILWLLLATFTSTEHPWRRAILAALAYAAAFLAGHSQTFLFLSYAAAAWLIFLVLREQLVPCMEPAPSRRGRLWLRGCQAAVFYVSFLALVAAQLWPSLEFTALSVRASVEYAFVSGGFPLQDTWQMLLPGVLTVYSPLYVGIAGLGLALLALVAAVAWPDAWQGRGGRGYVFFFAGLALLALLVSYGDQGFLYPLFYRWLPGWRLFRGQERAAYLVALGLSVLAGYGAALLIDGLAARRARAWAVGFLAFVVAGTAVFALGWAIPGHVDVPPATFWRIAVTAVILAAGLAAIAFWRSGRGSAVRRGFALALIALALADLFLANVRTNLGDASLAQTAAVRPEIGAVRDAVEARATANLGLPGRVHNEYRVYDDYGMLAGVEDVWGSSPLKLAGYAALFDKFPMDRMWRLLGVQHVLTWQKTLPQPSELLAEFPQAKDTTYLHRLAAINPRAWIVHEARSVEDAAALPLLADHGFDLDRTALLAPGLPAPELGATGKDSVRLARSAPGQLIADVQSERGGLLVVSENWLPGWQARVQAAGRPGTERPAVLRADLTLLAVPVPAGASTVELAYRPASVWAGLAISAAAVVLLVGALLRLDLRVALR